MNRFFKLILTTFLLIGALAVPLNSVAAEKSQLEVHFINVDQGDSSLVICDGEAMLIDGGKPGFSDLIYSYLKSHSINRLKCIVNTHPESDHIGGLSGALNYASVDMAFCPTTSYDSDAFRNFTKYLKKQNVSITVPKPGDYFYLGKAKVTVIAPISRTDDTNNNSIVLRIEHGDNSFLFTGDAETIEENDILSSKTNIKSTVLKVGHHGSSSSTSDDFLEAVSPQYAVISVGEENSYGHPTADTLNKLNKNKVSLYRTDIFGTIVCTSDGKGVSFSVEKNSKSDPYVIPENPKSRAESTTTSPANNSSYVLNTNTKKFHYPYCSSVLDMKEKNKKVSTESRESIISKGYKPCGRCNP